MAVAYSDKTIVRSSISGSPAAAMVSDLNTILIGAGWIVTTTLTGGFIYEITSPQTVHYKARVLIQDDVNYKIDHPAADLYNFRSLVLQVMNVAQTVVSFPYQLQATGAFAEYQVIAGICQLFISVPGRAGGAWSAVACGIPFVPPNVGSCSGPADTVVDIWWANGGSQFAFDWRTQANCYACMTYYLNGAVVIAADNNNVRPLDGLLCLFPLTAVNTYASNQISWPTITYSSHQPLNIDAFVGWAWSMRGQIWDAYLQTAAGTLDAFVTGADVAADGGALIVRSLTWHSEFFSSLQLIFEITGGNIGNVAY